MDTKIKVITALIVSISASLAFSTSTHADILIPTVTNVYFEKDGKHYNKPVKFTVSCFGYSWAPGEDAEKAPGTYTPEIVFSFSATCPRYGCKIYENYYLNYRHIDYCDLEGKTKGKEFKVPNYTTYPVENCTDVEPRLKKDKNKPSQAHPIERECTLNITIPALTTPVSNP